MILGYPSKFATIRALGLEGFLKSHGLQGWLEVATDDLADSAKSRITTEIQTHYDEAVLSHLADGETEESARSNALKELGDPRDAKERFQKTYLTVREERWLIGVESTATAPFFSFRTLDVNVDLLFPVGVCLLLVERSVGILILLIFVCARVVPRMLNLRVRPRSKLITMLIFGQIFTYFVAATWYLVEMHLWRAKQETVIDILLDRPWIYFLAYYYCTRPLRLLKKVRSSAFAGSKFAPPDPTT